MKKAMLAALVVLALTSTAAAQPQPAPIDIRAILGNAPSPSNTLPILVCDGATCITSFTEDFLFDLHTAGTTEVAGYAIAIEGSSGPQAVGPNVPLPVYTTSASVISAVGNVAHGTAASGNPLQMAVMAAAHGTNPTAVAAGAVVRALGNRAGIPFSGIVHPNIISEEWTVTDSDGAQTGTPIIDISAGTKIVVIFSQVTCDADNTTDVNFRMAFDTDTTLPTASVNGVDKIIHSQPGILAGGGSTVVKESTGGDGEDIRYSLDDPAGGECRGVVKYYTIES